MTILQFIKYTKKSAINKTICKKRASAEKEKLGKLVSSEFLEDRMMMQEEDDEKIVKRNSN
jgi:hypothetical protein